MILMFSFLLAQIQILPVSEDQINGVRKIPIFGFAFSSVMMLYRFPNFLGLSNYFIKNGTVFIAKQ